MKASVIIIARNEEEHIESCLESLKKQSFKDFETILIDDGSSDNTVKKAKKFKVKVLEGKGKGRAHARNLGVSKAKNPILAFLDADAVADKEWLKNLLKNFEKQEVKAVVGKVIHTSKKKNLLTTLLKIDAEYRKDFNKKQVEYFDTANCAIRKNVFKNPKVFEEKDLTRGTDTYLVNKLEGLGIKITYEPKAVIKHYDIPEKLKAFAKKEFCHGKDFSNLFIKTKNLKGYEHVRPWLYIQPILYYSLLTPFYPANIGLILAATILLNLKLFKQVLKKRARLILPMYFLSVIRNFLWFLGSLNHVLTRILK
ncbi:MAG: glycosyltransferase [Nanoarchaeota archaeon]|nr:glycosyltransferase [Nanoarchaeota archaeon]